MLTFPKGAAVTRLPRALLALDEMSCWSSVGLQNYGLSMGEHLEMLQGNIPIQALKGRVQWPLTTSIVMDYFLLSAQH